MPGPHPATQGCVLSVALGDISCPRRVCCRASAPFPPGWPLALAPGNRAAPQTHVGVGWNGGPGAESSCPSLSLPLLPQLALTLAHSQCSPFSSLNGVALPCPCDCNPSISFSIFAPSLEGSRLFWFLFPFLWTFCLPPQCRDLTHAPVLAQCVADTQ